MASSGSQIAWCIGQSSARAHEFASWLQSDIVGSSSMATEDLETGDLLGRTRESRKPPLEPRSRDEQPFVCEPVRDLTGEVVRNAGALGKHGRRSPCRPRPRRAVSYMSLMCVVGAPGDGHLGISFGTRVDTAVAGQWSVGARPETQRCRTAPTLQAVRRQSAAATISAWSNASATAARRREPARLS